ncbi:sugar ABC transporter permease [Candidatus Aerophobetes bacterium]|nr:sugar ABC transporter permease [Candidatus Aerophobetes bacterium]
MKVRNISSLEKRRWITAYLFIAPIVILFAMFRVYPFLFDFVLAFMKWNVFKNKGTWVGLSNYAKLIHDDTFFHSLKITLLYTLIYTPIEIIVGLGVALLLNVKFLGRSFCRTIFFMPYIFTSIATAAIWTWLYDPTSGLINAVLEQLHLPTCMWLQGEKTALGSIIIYTLWREMGYSMIIFLAGLQGIPQRYYEAARIDGANKFQSFIYITLPLLTPIVLFVLVMVTIGSFGIFGPVYVMTGGGPADATLVLVLYMYRLGFRYLKFGYGAAVGVMFFILTLIVTIVELKILGKRKVSYY